MRKRLTGASEAIMLAVVLTLMPFVVKADAQHSTMAHSKGVHGAPPWTGYKFREVSADAENGVGYGGDCAVRRNHLMMCWGSQSRWHQPPAGRFREVGVGNFASCGLRTSGRMVCWPFARAGLPGRYVSLSVGGAVCALSRGGRPRCRGFSGRPVPDGRFTDVSSGDTSACGVRENGRIACWGNVSKGRHATAGTYPPKRGTYREVSMLDFEACAIRLDGRLACWSYDSSRKWAPAGQFKQVTIGDGFGCGLRANGGVICWPKAGLSSPRGRFTDVSAGLSWACGVRVNSSLDCWGRDVPR